MASFTASHNPWSVSDTLSGIRLGNPQGGLGLARSFGLLSDGGELKVWPNLDYIMGVH